CDLFAHGMSRESGANVSPKQYPVNDAAATRRTAALWLEPGQAADLAAAQFYRSLSARRIKHRHRRGASRSNRRRPLFATSRIDRFLRALSEHVGDSGRTGG